VARAPREAPPPGDYIRSASGTVAKVVYTRDRDHRGRKLYRLRFSEGVISPQRWTLDELLEQGVRWLKRKPKEFRKTSGQTPEA
jgi:hypothetical protein